MERQSNSNTPEKPAPTEAERDHAIAVERNAAFFNRLKARTPNTPFDPLRAAIKEAVERAQTEATEKG